MAGRPAAQWVLGVAGATRYPTDGQGGATATAANSALVNAKKVEILGFVLTTPAAVAASVVDNSGSTIAGLTMTFAATSAPGFYPFAGGDTGVYYANTTTANVGITCGAALTALLVYRQIG